MRDSLAELQEKALHWFERAAAAGWIPIAAVERARAIERAAPGDLFAEQSARPLVVALFGGTGAGKSSLLNRLAGAPIARTGAERPTSRELTLYVHASQRLSGVAGQFPIEAVRVVRHECTGQRETAWIDAPDIDSTHEENRRLVDAWLPHIDLVIYVLSPERYRDDAGWRILSARGARHGWLFVLNRWDEGHVQQRDDLRRMLEGAGFRAPLIFCTSCAGQDGDGAALPSADEFDQIVELLDAVRREQGVAELERLGQRARFVELRATLADALTSLGTAERWATARREWQELWEAARGDIRCGAEALIRLEAARLAEWCAEAGVAKPEVLAAVDVGGGQSLWDSHAAGRLQSVLDGFEAALRRAGLPAAATRARLDAATADAAALISLEMTPRVRRALAQPGARWQRAAHRVTGFLMTLMPLLALGWVGLRIVVGFYAAGETSDYFDARIAVHGALLVLVAWAVPFALDRLVRPSVGASVAGALRAALAAALDALSSSLERRIDAVASDVRLVRDEATVLLAQLEDRLSGPPPASGPLLSRLVAGRMEAVRA